LVPGSRLELEEVGEFYEELPGVMQHLIGTDDFVSVFKGSEGNVLEIPVITHVEGGPGIEQIGEENVGIEILFSFQSGFRRVGQDRVILQNDADREFRVELPVPARTNDMVGENAVFGTGRG